MIILIMLYMSLSKIAMAPWVNNHYPITILHNKTKSGSMMSRYYYDATFKNNKTPGLGDTIYYVNNGEKSHGDVQLFKKIKPTEEEIFLYESNNGVLFTVMKMKGL